MGRPPSQPDRLPEAQTTPGTAMRRRDNIKAVASLLDFVLLFAVALGAYVLLARQTLDHWRIMPPSSARVVELKSFLHQQVANHQEGDVYLLGSSVLLEGIDCGLMDPLLPGHHCSFNLAWTGAGPRQWLLVLPSVVAARPSAVVLGVDLMSITSSSPIPENLLAIAGRWDFIPRDDLPDLRAVLSPPEYRLLTASKLKQLLALRSLPLGALDAYAREVSRRDLRYEGYTTNFKAPWVRTEVVSSASMKRGIANLAAQLRAHSPDDFKEPLQVLHAVVNYLHRDDCPVIIVLTPINPALNEALGSDLIEQASRELSTLADRNGAVFLDHSAVLPAEEYSDPVHPFDAGRRHWSAVLGQAIAERLAAEPRERHAGPAPPGVTLASDERPRVSEDTG
jgi:hypothetical protein